MHLILPSQYRAQFRVIHVLFVAEDMILERICLFPSFSHPNQRYFPSPHLFVTAPYHVRQP